MKKGKVLFADNNMAFLVTRKEFLAELGYEVIVASNPFEAKAILADKWIHLAVVDLRLTDDTPDDISGLTLVRESNPIIPKIVLTAYPTWKAVREALGPRIDELPPAIDFVSKNDGPEAMMQAVQRAFDHNVRINWNLAFDWKRRDPFGLVKLIESELDGERLLDRTDEFEDLFRRLFYDKEHLRIEHLLWNRNGRLALVVFAFKEGIKPEACIVVCGQNTIVNEEARHFEEFAPKALSETSTTLGEKMRAETTHFAANAYTLAGNDLENVQTLAELYHLGPDRTFNAALSGLYQGTLKAWHQEKPISEKGTTLDALYRKRLQLNGEFTQEYFEKCISTIETQISTLGARIERTEEILTIHFSRQSFTYPDPIPLLSQVIEVKRSTLLITVPGTLSGDNILTDEIGRTWLTDFAEAGLAPLLWNFVALEAVIRFDWVETKELQRRHELERCLIFTDFARPDTRDLESDVRKPARAIQTIRKFAARAVGRDTTAYHLGIFFHAARRLADLNPAYPLTVSELARLGQVLLSMAMIAERLKLEKVDEHPVTPALVAEISIANEKARIVMIGDRKERLAPRPFEVFWYLYQHANQVCTKGEILEDALGNKYDESYLHTLIGRIRKVIEHDPQQPSYLITEPNAGYRLISKPE